jgi:hypothetical protein
MKTRKLSNYHPSHHLRDGENTVTWSRIRRSVKPLTRSNMRATMVSIDLAGYWISSNRVHLAVSTGDLFLMFWRFVVAMNSEVFLRGDVQAILNALVQAQNDSAMHAPNRLDWK